MKIAVPYKDGEVFQKFGPAEYFKLYDVDNGQITGTEVVSTEGIGHAGLADMLKGKGTDELIGGGIGPGAQQKLTDLGIKFYTGVTGSADDAVKAYLNGTLKCDGKMMVYVGQWTAKGSTEGGGISIYELGEDGHSVAYKGHFPAPQRASALTYIPETGTLYAVNQLKGKGRNAWREGSTLWAYRVDKDTGMLTEIDRKPTMGGNPEAMSRIPGRSQLVVACTGGTDHVEKIVQRYDGRWETYYEYDDGAISLFALNDDGTIGDVLDVAVHREHGPDPSPSPQHDGRCQMSGHPHSCTVDPTGQFVLSGDKGTDKIYVYRIHESRLERLYAMWLGDCTGGRHIAFDPVIPNRLYMTTEYSSELFSFDLNPSNGVLTQLDRISTVAPDFTGRNEPATLRLHPSGKYIYVNNRGEDNIITVEVAPDGKLTRKFAFQLSRFSGDPVNATRQFEMSPDSRYLFVAERPANLLHVLSVNDDGTLSDVESTDIINPSSVCFVRL